ncbi:MFS transporter [Actinoplanes derwentensis]|uniref:Major Facilitator Superfamily protein n=1 Tax=Actinoplanes derwentensis TaxID=113562 RepID=A0A1H2BAJ4_9ACTN|nr:MFS transporter [Actinoplanes derwentensis]GID86504.1 MFS transporter [Actinoplanes derwentensis]SDT55305.1 Major Facilitator Superfamily protein [Actinoplanes derwentensis]
MYVTVRDRPAAGSSATGRVATTVLLLGTVSLLTDVSSEMVASVLPLYLTMAVGLSPVAYGFLDGMYQGVSAFLRIAGGYAGDRGGQPKWVAVAGYGASALSRIAMLPATGFAAITAVVTVDRLGKGLRTAPRDALIAESSDPAMLGRSFGVHRALDTVGAALGPLVAFALLASVPGSFDSIFVVSFAFAVVGLAVLVLFVPNLRTAAGTARIGLRRTLREVGGRRLRRPLLAAGVLGLLTVGDGFLYLTLQDRDDFAAVWFPLLYVGTNVAYLALAVPLGRLADRVGRARVLVGGHVALLACYLLGALPSGGVALTVAVLLLLGVFYAATDGVLPALVSRLIPAEARGSGIAAAQTVVALARFASSVLFGLMWSVQGPSQSLLVFAGLLLVAIPFIGWLLRGVES